MDSHSESDSEYIQLKVVQENSTEIQVRVKQNSELVELKQTYSDMVGVPISSLRFLFHGTRIDGTESPQSLDMETDDQIEVYEEQRGGGIMYQTLDEASEYVFEIRVMWRGNSTWLTVLPGMNMKDLAADFASQTGLSPRDVKLSVYSSMRKTVMNNISDDATPEMLGLGPDDLLAVQGEH